MQNRTLTSSLALSAIFGIAVAAAPFALDADLKPLPNAALAQASGGDNGAGDSGAGDGEAGARDDGTADDGMDGIGTDDPVETGAGTDNTGVADERATAAAGSIPDETADSVYEILGTTRAEAEAADTEVSASAQYGPLETYQTEVERGNLDAAAENLAAMAGEPITEEMVTDLNTELGVETTLSDDQIAEAAASKQDSAN